MKTAIVCSVVFLLLYIAHHITSESTNIRRRGRCKVCAIILCLLSHILLSVLVIPFVLITYVRAITNDFERHKKIAKITFPLWLVCCGFWSDCLPNDSSLL